MTEKAKRNSTASDNYFDYAMKTMKENEEFLYENLTFGVYISR